jgi:uncharacterized small protein (DUF1192 family)
MPGVQDSLPDDVAELKKRIALLEDEVNTLRAKLFDRKSEKLSKEDARQARLFNEAVSLSRFNGQSGGLHNLKLFRATIAQI